MIQISLFKVDLINIQLTIVEITIGIKDVLMSAKQIVNQYRCENFILELVYEYYKENIRIH